LEVLLVKIKVLTQYWFIFLTAKTQCLTQRHKEILKSLAQTISSGYILILLHTQSIIGHQIPFSGDKSSPNLHLFLQL